MGKDAAIPGVWAIDAVAAEEAGRRDPAGAALLRQRTHLREALGDRERWP